MAVTFNGSTKLIACNAGTTSLNVRSDAYSRWKDWLLTDDNMKFLPAFSTLGGDEISTGEFVGDFYFLENGWKIKPQEANHVLSVIGNLFSRDGSNPYVSTTGSYNVTIKTKYAALTNQIVSAGAEMTINADAVATAVVNKSTAGASAGTVGGQLNAAAESSGGEGGGLTEEQDKKLKQIWTNTL